MRRLPFIAKHYLLAGLILLMSVSACDDNDGLIVDWAPVSISITVTDSNGNDLLNPQSNSNILDGTSLTFKEKTYEVSYDFMNHFEGAKAYMPTMYGLQLDTARTDGNALCRLLFGEIDGGADMNEDLVINWGNGTTDVINYQCSKHNERKLSCKREWKVNGKKFGGEVRQFAFEK